MFAPLAIAWGLVVNAGKELEVLEGNLLGLDAQLVFQLPPCGVLNAPNGIGEG